MIQQGLKASRVGGSAAHNVAVRVIRLLICPCDAGRVFLNESQYCIQVAVSGSFRVIARQRHDALSSVRERNLIFLQTELSKLSIPLASAAAVCIDTQVYVDGIQE
jgi:hypothetical protein